MRETHEKVSSSQGKQPSQGIYCNQVMLKGNNQYTDDIYNKENMMQQLKF